MTKRMIGTSVMAMTLLMAVIAQSSLNAQDYTNCNAAALFLTTGQTSGGALTCKSVQQLREALINRNYSRVRTFKASDQYGQETSMADLLMNNLPQWKDPDIQNGDAALIGTQHSAVMQDGKMVQYFVTKKPNAGRFDYMLVNQNDVPRYLQSLTPKQTFTRPAYCTDNIEVWRPAKPTGGCGGCGKSTCGN